MSIKRVEDSTGQGAGFLTKTLALLNKNRLGEVLVYRGHLTPQELRHALARQKNTGETLGRILVRENLVPRSAVRSALIQQWMMKMLAGLTTLVICLACLNVRQAKAGPIKDVPARMSLVAAANAAFAPIDSYPALFGADERRSTNIEPFTKWIGMFGRFDAAMNQEKGRRMVGGWKDDLSRFEGLGLREMAERVNDYVNSVEYIEDNQNYGKSDYWATPIEFFSRGGDCEDFAIAKYVSLRALGVPEERLRIAIVHDLQKDIPHAVLIVYTDDGAYVLDNQNKRMLNAAGMTRYRPIFSINRHAWWLHTKPKPTVIASAD